MKTDIKKNKNAPSKKNEKDGKKKVNTEELETLLKDKKEELLRTTQKKIFLEKKLNEKNIELDTFRKEYKELQNHLKLLDHECNKYEEHLTEKKNAIYRKSVFYNYENLKEMEKLEKEKNELKALINEKHEKTINSLMNRIENQRLNLASLKNKNFYEISQLNESFNQRVNEIKGSFQNYLQQYEIEKQEQVEEVIEDCILMEKNEITFLKNLYSDNIKEINEIHETLLQDLKKYYIDIIKENICKMKNLKTTINELNVNEKEVKNDLLLLHNESKSITEEINNLEIKRENLKKDLKFYSKDFVLYKNLELIYNESTLHIKHLKVVANNIDEQIREIENELHTLSEDINVEDYFDSVRKENINLKKKVEQLNLNLEDVTKELKSYLQKHNIKEEEISKVKTGTEFTVKAFNKELENLGYMEKKIKNKMKENINIYEQKLKNLNIQEDK